MKTNTKTVKRHSFLYRFLHWLIVIQVLLLILSGLIVSDYISLNILNRGIGRNLHAVISLFWTGTIIFFVYYFIISGEYKWFGLSRIGEAFDFLMHEIRCFVTGKGCKNQVVFDEAKNEYVEKIVPTEVLAWWGWFVLWLLMVLTGFALLYPVKFTVVHNLCHVFVPSVSNAIMATRIVHLTIALFIGVFMLIHAYASWTFGMVGSMFSGLKKEQVINTKEI